METLGKSTACQENHVCKSYGCEEAWLLCSFSMVTLQCVVCVCVCVFYRM